jgi:rod shape determining protein RodA
MRESTLSTWRHFDFWLLGAVALLVIFGITMIRSAIAGNIELAQLDLVRRQLIFAGAGFLVILITASIDYHLWASISRTMYIVTLVVLFALYVVGAAFFGSARWFDTGVILIQPSEIAKIVMVLVLANFFSRSQNETHDVRWIIRSFLMTLGITIWILLQPNLSTSIVMFVLWLAMLWASGLRIKHIMIFTLVGLVFLLIAVPLMIRFNVILQDYQLQRVINFISPDPNARHGESYNIEQALISIGSGGLLGQGYGHGSQVQLRFLKVRHSDLIFSALAQEFGFVGTVVLMLVLMFVIYRCLRAARIARDTFGGLIAYGVAVMIAFQAIVNIGVNLRLMPATGLTLPFVSYGGSSLLSILLGIGLVESVILRHKALEFTHK